MMRRLIVTGSLCLLSSAYTRGQVECPTPDGPNSFTVIPADKVNDGYCDCPLTGADETRTAACAGSMDWAGVFRGGETSAILPLFYSCPKQPKLKVPLSRLNDGICDCCNGSDERSGLCPDNCDAVFAEERRLRKEMEENFRVGSQIRQKAVTDFATMRKEKLSQVAKLETELTQTETSLDELKEKYKTMEIQWIKERLTTVDTQLRSIALTTTTTTSESGGKTSIVTGMMEALSPEELTWWIIHACQISGEMMTTDGSFVHDNSNNLEGTGGSTKTCIPLRMAGLDSEIWWEPKTYEMTAVYNEAENSELLSGLAQLLDYNLKNPKSLNWHRSRLPKLSSSSSSSSSVVKRRHGARRRLEDIHDDEDYEHYDDEHYDDEHYDDEELEDEDHLEEEKHDHRRGSRGARENSGEEIDSESTGDRREEVLALLKSQSFSKSRVRYLAQSSSLLQTIEALTKEVNEVEGAEEDGDTPEQGKAVEGDESSSLSSKVDVQFDPMALPMTKNKLQHRVDAIQRGFDFAISARVLMDSLHSFNYEGDDAEKQKLGDLRRLALGVVNHGKLSSYHVWQLYRSVVPELAVPLEAEGEDGSCVAPWASSCPPSTTKRSLPSGNEMDVPPQPIVDAATSYCNTLMSQSTPVEAICSAPGPNDSIPSEVPDGYFGYYQISARADNDFMSQVFRGLGLHDNSDLRKNLLDMQDQLESLEESKNQINRDIKQALDAVGGKEEPKALGKDGELFHLKDQCFTYDTASYTYELCLFQKAKQRDSGTSHGGTHLGDWTGQILEEASDEGQSYLRRVWKWERGTKCWNGPQRTASALVTCGRETKILSAEEPETCTYVLRVESPIACDNEFKARHSLF